MPQTPSASLIFGIALLGKRRALDLDAIRRRCLRDRAFRALCEEYGLACQSEMRLRDQGGAALADYVTLIAELEAEVIAALGLSQTPAMESGGALRT